jgi:CheY-like chemotaxis protein
MMPRLNGLETAGLIHQRESSCALPLLLLTGFDEDGLKTLSGWSPLLRVEYLGKPVEAEALREAVSRMLQGFSASVAPKQAMRSDSALTPRSHPSS